MPTTKRRINITPDKATERALVKAAKRDGLSTASKAAELLRIALELEEDTALGMLAEQRMKEKPVKFISHKEAWAGFL